MGSPPQTLAQWRWLGKGPEFVKVGSRVRYPVDALDRWLSTGQRPNAQPDWNVAFFDGQPEIVVNLPAVALLTKSAPCGLEEATRRMRRLLPAGVFTELSELLKEDIS